MPDPDPPQVYAPVQISVSVRGSELNLDLSFLLITLSGCNGLSTSTLQKAAMSWDRAGRQKGKVRQGLDLGEKKRVVTRRAVLGVIVNEPRLQIPST